MPQKLLLKIRYNGAGYVGWQIQKNDKSVQEQMQDAVEEIFGARVGITGCSRTDSGVHALEYCLCFDPPRSMELKRIPFALNAVLPRTISLLSCDPHCKGKSPLPQATKCNIPAPAGCIPALRRFSLPFARRRI